MNPQCKIHNKPLKQGKYGWYCATLLGENPDGTKNWCKFKIEDTVATVPEESTTPVKQPEPIRTGVMQAEPFKARDFNAEARGKVRNGIAIAFIGHVGPVELTSEIITVMSGWVDWIMDEQLLTLKEEIKEEELDEIAEKMKNQKENIFE